MTWSGHLVRRVYTYSADHILFSYQIPWRAGIIAYVNVPSIISPSEVTVIIIVFILFTSLLHDEVIIVRVERVVFINHAHRKLILYQLWRLTVCYVGLKEMIGHENILKKFLLQLYTITLIPHIDVRQQLELISTIQHLQTFLCWVPSKESTIQVTMPNK